MILSKQIFLKRILPIENKRNEHHYWVLYIGVNLSTKFQLKLGILIFWTKFVPESVFTIRNGKSKYHHWILHLRISLGTKFQVKLTLLIFWTKFVQKRCFWSIAEKVHTTIELDIFELVCVQNFRLTDSFDFLDYIYPKRVFPFKTK